MTKTCNKKSKRNKFEAEEREVAMRTARARGAVGARAIVPKVVAAIATKSDKILDFGAGKEPVHAMALRDAGFNVSFYDFNLPSSEVALSKKYNLIYASNVLNVQSSATMALHTLKQVWESLTPTGRFVANYPTSPRKSDLKPEAIEFLLEKFFESVCQIAGPKSAPVWMAQGKKKDPIPSIKVSERNPEDDPEWGHPHGTLYFLGVLRDEKGFKIFKMEGLPTKKSHGRRYAYVHGPFANRRQAEAYKSKA